ncbi:MAG: hypothetical protein IKP75_03290 [Oscillospiraceae bacterium]|nr:hypothetical protein [Oscillospiraceae bacterium]
MKKSLLDSIGDEKKEQLSEELHRESLESLEQARADEEKRRSYESKLRQQRLELMKLKQGIIDEEELPKEETPPPKEYTFREKAGNFFYHNKAYLIAGAVAAAFLIFLAADYMKAERPDVSALFIAQDDQMMYYANELTDGWSAYVPDYNKDRKHIAKLYYVPAEHGDSPADQYLAQSDSTKLLGEFQSGNTIIIIGTKEVYEKLGLTEGVFADARELFPGDENASELGYAFGGTDLAALMGYEGMDTKDLIISFRKPQKTFGMSEEKMQENFDHAVEFFRAYLAEHRTENQTETQN